MSAVSGIEVQNLGKLIRRLLLTLSIAIAMTFGTSGAMSAIRTPTPKSSAKVTVKATPKSTKKPVAKQLAVAKRPIYQRRPVGVSPSPTPGWPPRGFHANGDVFAKVPTSIELLGVLSASAPLAKAFKVCSKFACGVVQVASYSGCTWWEITSTLSGRASATDPKIVIHGSIRTTAAASRAKQIVTILLISSKPLKININVRNINITCYHSPRTETVPTNRYSPNIPTPTPTPTLTPTPTESATGFSTPSPTESATPTN